MAALPEDDGPTMIGAPAERRADHALPAVDASDSDDTTTAEAGPPTSRDDLDDVEETGRTGPPDPHVHEDRTVQKKIDPPLAARKPSGLAQAHAGAPAPAARPPSAPPSRAPAPLPAAGTPPSAPIPSTEPDGAVATTQAVGPITQTTETEVEPTDITDELADDLSDDAEPIEDSVTATAPRLDHALLMQASQSGHGLPISIPGSVEIRSVEHDDLLDETEIRTRPGHSPLHIPITLRGSPAPIHASSQPPPPPRPAAGRPPSSPDNDDDGVTAQSLAPAMASSPDLGVAPATSKRAPDTAPQSRSPAPSASATASASVPRAASPRPAAGVPFRREIVEEPPTRPGVVAELDGADEPPTRPGVEGAEEPPTRPGVEGVNEPATRPGLGESPTRPGKPDPETARRLDVKLVDPANTYANEDDDEESITARGRVAEPYEEQDESVTTQAPAVPTSIIEAAINAPNVGLDGSLDDGTEGTGGTTQRVKKTREAALSSPADSEAESITTQAPGPLTNILRVIASGSSPSLGSDPALSLLDEDEPPENRTAVMANAPLKRVIAELTSASALPAIRPTGGPMLHGPQGSAARRLEPSSESGLRVARAAAGDRHSGVGRSASALASDGSISAGPMDRAHMSGEQGVFPGLQPSVHDVDLGKGPRYGLLVAIVAVISVIVPVTLFVVLHHPADAVAPGIPAEPASEIEKHDGARIKGVRGKNGQLVAPSASVAPSAAPAPSAAASTKPGGRGFPFHR